MRYRTHEFKATMREFDDILELESILKKQVRKLSLGERMKCELAAALLHRPSVLFLDEPTIGLDVNMQVRIREFIAEYNRRFDATVILTSHYMADVTALCRRIIVIDHGKIVFDGDLSRLIEQSSPHKVVRLELAHPVDRRTTGNLWHGANATKDCASKSTCQRQDTREAGSASTGRTAGRGCDDRGPADRGSDRPDVRRARGDTARARGGERGCHRCIRPPWSATVGVQGDAAQSARVAVGLVRPHERLPRRDHHLDADRYGSFDHAGSLDRQGTGQWRRAGRLYAAPISRPISWEPGSPAIDRRLGRLGTGHANSHRLAIAQAA